MHPPASGCTIRLLGVPKVWIHGRQAAIHRRLVRALLYYVAAHPDGVSQDVLASLLSPDEPQRTARRRLTRLLWHLRNALGPEASAGIHADADRLWLNATWRGDVHAFTAALEPIRAWRNPAEAGQEILEAVAKGVALYRGEFLSGFALPRHSEFENWVLLERERLEQLYVEALVFLAQAYAVQGDYPRAITFARQGIEVEPIREDLHRLLMQMYERTGQRAAALSQYERCVIILEKELGEDPLPETRDLYQAILRGAPLPSLAPRAPSHVWDAPPGMDVPFVGRERILKRLIREWDKTLLGMGRMVFLRGEPGIGKTRLVHEFVRRVDAPILVGAGELARALEATLAALERAAQQFAFRHVIHLADRALALATYLPKTSPVLTARASALLWRGRAHRALRRYQEAQMDLEQAICLGETLALTKTVVEALAEKIHIAIDRWQSAEAEALAERCVLAAQQGRDMHLWARSIYLKEMVAVHFRRAVDEASLSKALEVFEKNADNVSMAEVWNLRGVYAMLQRDYESALAALDKALALRAQAHHYFLMHRIQANRGHVLYNRGDFAAAWEAFTRAEEWLHNVGVDRPDNIFEVGRGYVAIHLGRTEEGEEALKRARSLARNMGSVLGQVYVGLHLALLRGLQGRFDEAFSLLSPFFSQEKRIYPATQGLFKVGVGKRKNHR